MRQIRLRPPARRDLFLISIESLERFGPEAQHRYTLLVDAALRDLAAKPDKSGTHTGPELSAGVHLYHLRHSRKSLGKAERVGAPRHLIAYQYDDKELIVLRVLHDSMDVDAQLSETREE
jgi:toxin ParE1/3/4